MSRIPYDTLCADAEDLSTFTYDDMRKRGHSRYELAAAVQDRLIVVAGLEQNGLPGRPRTLLKLTAKGARVARKHREHLADVARAEKR